MGYIAKMARYALTDNLWGQLQATMKAYGCYQTKNSREVMEAILWKLRTGAPWRDIPEELRSWKTAYNRFNRWSKNGLCKNFFLAYEKKLIRKFQFYDLNLQSHRSNPIIHPKCQQVFCRVKGHWRCS